MKFDFGMSSSQTNDELLSIAQMGGLKVKDQAAPQRLGRQPGGGEVMF